jgi:ribosomal protein S18 acetylase RimI-like enzyme
MTNHSFVLERSYNISPEFEDILYQGISENAFQKKGLPPMEPFSIILKDQNQKILGGLSGVIFYGSLYVDSLWVDETIRGQDWGTKLMKESEKMGREHGVKFINLNTMDWEALPFYQKLGFSIEFIREGYEGNSKMFLLRKNL